MRSSSTTDRYYSAPNFPGDGDNKNRSREAGAAPHIHRSLGDVDTTTTAQTIHMDTIIPASKFSQILDWLKNNRKTVVQACWIGIASIFGCLLRLLLAQLFGVACQNPNTVGWLREDAAWCVTRDSQEENALGIVFVDFPSNLLGSFLMGLWQDGAALGLAMHVPIAWLSPNDPFQGLTAIHLAIRVGFCGSLTTWSGWNSEMVVMMLLGSANDESPAANFVSQIWKALFGYIIGMEVALGAFGFGRMIAFWLHKWMNPTLALEMVAMGVREEQGYVVNPNLPSLERRFLPDLPLHIEKEYPPRGNTPGLDSLALWRESTQDARRLESPFSPNLKELETVLIAQRLHLTPHIEAQCKYQGWNIDALKQYLQETQHLRSLPTQLSPSGFYKAENLQDTLVMRLGLPLFLFISLWVCLLVATIAVPLDSSFNATYKTMAYSVAVAPLGALIRWKWDQFNDGRFLQEKLQWIPVGTLGTNWMGSCLSILLIAVEYRMEMKDVDGGGGGGGGGAGSFWTAATCRAFDIGFCGSLTTIHTVVAQIHRLREASRPDRAYKYICLSIMGSAILGTALFSLIVLSTAGDG